MEKNVLDNDDDRFISDDWWIGDPLPVLERRWWASLPFRVGLAALALVLACGVALAQQNRPLNCSQTVGASAAAVPFPAAGAVGPSAPKNYLMICNAHASNTLGVNAVGGTAAIGAAGTLTLPTVAQVETGVQYGAGGTEFTGTLSAGGHVQARVRTGY